VSNTAFMRLWCENYHKPVWLANISLGVEDFLESGVAKSLSDLIESGNRTP
jgi:hypothetical protein